MKNKRRYRIALAGFVCAGILFAGTMNCYAGEGLILPDKKIVNYFISGFKTTPQSDYGKLKGRMESLTLTDDYVERGDRSIVVALKYEDGTKDSFYFFQTAPDVEEWYVEAEDGAIYQGGEFITEYIQVDLFPESVSSEDDENASGMLIFSEDIVKEYIRKSQELHENLTKDGAVCGTEDLRAYFAMEMLKNEKHYEAEEKAMETVRMKLENGLRVYEYANQNGRLPSAEEVDEILEETRGHIKKDKNFEKLDALYRECGTTYDDFKEEMEDYERIDLALEYMGRKLREEFQFGNDTVGEKVCKNAEEYYACFMEDVIFPSTKEYVEETLKPLLDEAQEYYLKELGSGK